MNARLVALEEGPDIHLDRAMVVVGRHPACDARLDSLRVSRHHCCMVSNNGALLVRDLGSTNGIRINGERVEMGRLLVGDELSIAHIRYRLHGENELEGMQGGRPSEPVRSRGDSILDEALVVRPLSSSTDDNILTEAVRKMLPASMANRCRIQVIVQMEGDEQPFSPTAPIAPDGPPRGDVAE